jgi:hypothetical protein
MKVRTATPSDIPLIFSFIRLLAFIQGTGNREQGTEIRIEA